MNGAAQQPEAGNADLAKQGKSLAQRPETASYEVGYKKPPAATRFKKGQSGNPRGRPKGARNRKPAMTEECLQEIVLEEAYRTIPVAEQGRTISIPLAQAVVRSLAVNTAKGNTRAQHLFTELLGRTETVLKEQREALFEAAIDFKQRWESEFDRCDRLGIERPEVFPHPDDVVADPRTGTVRFKGPMTREEKEQLDYWIGRIGEFEEELKALRSDLEQPENKPYRETIQNEITFTENLLDKLRQLVPDGR